MAQRVSALRWNSGGKKRRKQRADTDMKSKRRKPIQPKRRTARNAPRSGRVAAARDTKVARLSRELREALEQQTATSEILGVISRSPTDVQPVLDTIVRAAVALCDSYDAVILLRDGEYLRIAAHHGPMTLDFAGERIGRDWVAGRTVVDRMPIHVHDLPAAGDDFPLGSVIARRLKQRTVLGLPLLREGQAIGCLFLRRTVVRPYSAKQIALLQTFADQAVIAIENVRLFDAEQQRAHELREALARQTATSEVLQVISSSTFDLETVFDTLLETAMRLCESNMAAIWRSDGQAFRLAASRGFSGQFEKFARDNPITPDRGSITGRTALDGRTVHIPDVLADPQYTSLDYQSRGNYRSALGVPLLREGETIGVFALTRSEVKPYTKTQIELVQSFAAQGVVAIENVRLLSELRESLQQQTATADVLKVISRSTFDLQAVLDTLVQSAAKLCEADMAALLRPQGSAFQQLASYGYSLDLNKFMETHPVQLGRGTVTGRTVVEGKIIHIPDVLADQEFEFIESVKIGGMRTMLGVPLLREGIPTGVIVLSRLSVRPFTDKQIDLVMTFADQAVIAIENTRLLNELRQRTTDLTRSLEDLRTAQDRLVQTEKLASLGQLTAGIAHEIKNPLNFVNNFSAISVELIDELKEVLISVKADDKPRAEMTELMETLRDNLDKVVQHGKRADSIVKNMLLHSREGSGERRLVDVNALVEESLNLAYHGARAERQGFNISLERSFDPAAGEVDVFPQEITRVLLNLIANGFYAATKRQGPAPNGGFEPTVSAATKSLGDRVEITIRDNGAGIPRDVKEKMFNPFFTTKPAGEGTGLGLSISHDIIVKQHSGSIEVDTRPGEFTEFRIILPRAAAPLAKSGEQT
jgi:two-component system NtrC family sensor kinase